MKYEIEQCAEEACAIAGERAALFHGTGNVYGLLGTDTLVKRVGLGWFTCSARMAAARAFMQRTAGAPAVLVFDWGSLQLLANCPPLDRHPPHERVPVLEYLLGRAIIGVDRHILGVAYLQQIKETS